jgi:steroid 5-alpha reductase family enzyme
MRLFLTDIFATLVVYIFSIIFKNTSVYDPYWSFVPWVLVLIAMIETKNFSVSILILFIAFSFWSWRLTINWIGTFKNMVWEDWRYTKYRKSLPRWMFEVVNFFGLQMMPTVLVFGGIWPFLLMIENGSNYISIIGAFIIILGTGLELLADHQMHQFLRETKEKKTCQKGLWKYSRHPNYLGEITIWFGIALTHLIQYPTQWYIDLLFIFFVLLFNFISIPMMEKRQLQRRSDYENYRKTTSRLLLLPRKRIITEEESVEEKTV